MGRMVLPARRRSRWRHRREAVRRRHPLPAAPPAVAVAPLPSDAEIERFLKEANIVRTKGTQEGRHRLAPRLDVHGKLTHDAQIQTIDEYKREFRTDKGVEFDFRDSWIVQRRRLQD